MNHFSFSWHPPRVYLLGDILIHLQIRYKAYDLDTLDMYLRLFLYDAEALHRLLTLFMTYLLYFACI